MSPLFLLRNSFFQLQHLILKSVESPFLLSALSVLPLFFTLSLSFNPLWTSETVCPLFSLPSHSAVMSLSWLQLLWLINAEFARITDFLLFCILHFFDSFKNNILSKPASPLPLPPSFSSLWTISDPLRKDNLCCFSSDLEGKRMTVVSKEPQLHLPTSPPTNHTPPPPPRPPRPR